MYTAAPKKERGSKMNQIITVSTTTTNNTVTGYNTIIGAALGNLANLAYCLADMADKASVGYEAVMPGIIQRVAKVAGAVWHVLTILAAKAWAFALLMGILLVATGKAACRLGKMVYRLARKVPGVVRMVAADARIFGGEVARLVGGMALALGRTTRRCIIATVILAHQLYQMTRSYAAKSWKFRAGLLAEVAAEEL